MRFQIFVNPPTGYNDQGVALLKFKAPYVIEFTQNKSITIAELQDLIVLLIKHSHAKWSNISVDDFRFSINNLMFEEIHEQEKQLQVQKLIHYSDESSQPVIIVVKHIPGKPLPINTVSTSCCLIQ